MTEVSETAERKSHAQLAELVAEYEAGELSQRAFCEQHDVAYSTFGYWRKRLRLPVVPLEPVSCTTVFLTRTILRSRIIRRPEGVS